MDIHIPEMSIEQALSVEKLRPGDDLKDPLNWSQGRKFSITAVLSLAAFIGLSSPLCGQLNLVQQAELYGKSTVQISYANSAAIAGIAFGGFIFSPIVHKIGHCAVIFWALLGCLACQIWAPLMTHPDQYNPYIISRLFCGIFGCVPAIIGPQLLIDIYPLHQRGRAFNAFHCALLFGTIAGPTFSALISAHTAWPMEYWWTVGLLGINIVLCFFILEDTGSSRQSEIRTMPESYLENRFRTLVSGMKLVPTISTGQLLKGAAIPITIAFSPVTVLLGIFTLIGFGFYIAMGALTPVWLQRGVADHGYGFTLEQNAEFTFFHWLGLFISLVYGHLLNDRIPNAICKRTGTWKSEYRLHSLWIALLAPIGLALLGVTLQYHLSWGVFALAQILVTVGSLCVVPIAVNYICECFVLFPVEVGIAMGAYRLSFGLTISFFINPWVASVGIGWAYGMMAIFSLLSFIFVIVLMWKGDTITKWRISALATS